MNLKLGLRRGIIRMITDTMVLVSLHKTWIDKA